MVLKSFQLLLVSIALVFPTSTLAAPINHHRDEGLSRSPRQTALGKPQVVQIMEIESDNTEVCPDYGDDQCDQIQDMICLSDVFSEAANHWRQEESDQVSVQAIHQCALINPHSGNNIRSHFQDLVTLTTMFRRVGQPGILPNANYSKVLCQLENTVYDLNKTIAYFCEYTRDNCSKVDYTCANDFPQNADREIQFNAPCNRQLLESLRAAMFNIMILTTTTTERPTCIAKSMKCIRANSEQVDVLNTFKATLLERNANISRTLYAQDMDECRARKDLYEPKNTTVFDVYNDLVGTVAFLGSLNASLPAQQDLFVSLNSTVLPTIRGMLEKVAVNEDMLNDMSVPYSLTVQLENVTGLDALTVCIVTRLNQLYLIMTMERLTQLSFIDKSGGYCRSQ